MFKRAVWMGAGFGAGLGSSFWVKRAVQRRVQRYVPDDMQQAVVRRAQAASTSVRGAVREGRAAMRQYQAEAEAQLAEHRRANFRVVGED